jgi:hypothetical protein
VVFAHQARPGASVRPKRIDVPPASCVAGDRTLNEFTISAAKIFDHIMILYGKRQALGGRRRVPCLLQ